MKKKKIKMNREIQESNKKDFFFLQNINNTRLKVNMTRIRKHKNNLLNTCTFKAAL